MHTLTQLNKKIKLVTILLFIICTSLIAQTENLKSGAFIINMSATNPNTKANGLKPYGLIYDLIRNYNVPIKWIINQSKSKDGIDFIYNGTSFSGGTFIIPAEYRNTTTNVRINYWVTQGVIGTTTTNNLIVDVTYTITSFPRWTLDAKNGSIAEGFLINAGITNTAFPGAYNWKDPQLLDACDDFFVMPHADPTWATHSRLYSWNKDCLGAIWAGCHAVSVLENMKNPLDASQQTNFLSTTGLVPYGSHGNGLTPYNHSFPNDPIAQYLGKTDLAHTNGSEQVFLPSLNGAWRSTTKIITSDPTQNDIPSKSAGPAAIILYGRGMGANDRGFVMYEGGHDLDKGSDDDIAAQRAFFNFSFFQLSIKSPQVNVNGVASNFIINSGHSISGFTVSASSPLPGISYTYQWSSNCGGVFSDPTSTSTNFTAANNSITTEGAITCLVKDNCGRTTFKSFPIKIIGTNDPYDTTQMSNSAPSVGPIKGFTELIPGTTTTLSCQTQNGAWNSSKNNVASVNNNGLVTANSEGETEISYSVSNTHGTTKVKVTVTVSGHSTNSGFSGGLESKSLGNAFAERVFNNIKENKSAIIDYSKASGFIKNSLNRGLSVDGGNGMQLSNFLPSASLIGNDVKAYVTTPLDILTFTNAVDIFSVDYTSNGINKAVGFVTKTLSDVYTHTKPVCDRLKGAVLLNIDTIINNQIKLIRYYLQEPNGTKEYAISFSIGENAATNEFVLQSEWMTDTYLNQETLYNFQLWSPDKQVLNVMLTDILNKFSSIKPIIKIGSSKLPKANFTYLKRDLNNQLQLELEISNHSSTTNAFIEVFGKQNEQSNNNYISRIPVVLTAFGTTKTTLFLKDIAEAEIKLIVDGVKEDFVYTNDGTWNIYASPNSTVSKFAITNDVVQPIKSDLRLFRNIELKAVTSSYITVYRVLKGGAESVDLSNYNFLKFVANGKGKIRIRIIKQSISKYEEQYQYSVNLTGEEKEYVIPTNQFTSSSASSITLNDVTVISFTYEVDAPNTTINSFLENVRFSKNALETNNNLLVTVFPNPATEKVNCIFNSEKAGEMLVNFVELGTGKLAFVQKLNSYVGQNEISIQIPQSIKSGMYVIKIYADNQQYASKIISVIK